MGEPVKTEREVPPLIVVDNDFDVEENWNKKLVCNRCGRLVGKPHAGDCDHYIKHWWETKLPLVDLRPICRESEKAYTQVEVFTEPGQFSRHTWIKAGLCDLTHVGSDRYSWSLSARLGRGATDIENSSAYAFVLPLVGVQHESTRYHKSVFLGVVDSGESQFHVPKAGYNPFDPDSMRMSDCDDPHPIVEYLPPEDRIAEKLLRGKRVRITIGLVK